MASKKPIFQVIDNSGPNNIGNVLKAKLSGASEVCIAVAFITQAGLDEVIQSLRQVAAGGSVRLITGLYQRFTEPQALRTLLDIQKKSRGHFLVRMSKDPHFHSKLYLLAGNEQATVIIGSSNLTQDGLRSSGELNLMVSFPRNNHAYRKLAAAFEKDWKHRAVLLTASQIKRYDSRRKTAIRLQSLTERQLEIILETKTVHETSRNVTESHIRYWRDYISGYVSKRTERQISEKTNWDEKQYQWYSTGSSHPYSIDDEIFIFDFTSKLLRRVKVVGVARMPILTTDGRYFVAFKTLRYKHLSRTLWDQLRQFGLNKNNASNKGYISLRPEKAKRLLDELWG
jgi:HKD family nuclease